MRIGRTTSTSSESTLEDWTHGGPGGHGVSDDDEAVLFAGEAGTDGFHNFDNVEKTEVDVYHQTSLPRSRGRWSSPSTNPAIYMADITFGNLGLLNVWRLPAVALAMSIQWQSYGKLSLLNFLIPYVISILAVAWPLLVLEIGGPQVVKGGGPKFFGSLSKRSRAAGLSGIMSAATLLFMSGITSYCLEFALHCGMKMAAYNASTELTIEDKIQQRNCVKYNDYLPSMNPLLCTQQGQRLDVSCMDPNDCQLWSGEGRCIAVPWAPAAEYLITNAEALEVDLDSDYPQYCAARWLHDLTTNEAKAVMSDKASWADYGNYFAWRLPVAFAITFGCVFLLGCTGDSLGSLIRIASGLLGVTTMIILLVCGTIWFNKNSGVQQIWLASSFFWDFRSLGRPEIWAHAIVSALITLNVGSNQMPTIAAKAPSENMNIVVTSSIVTVTQSVFGYLMLWLVFLAYGAATVHNEFGVPRNEFDATIRYDIRNMPYGTIFTSIQTMFDNSGTFDGTSPRSAAAVLLFWITMFVLGVLTCHRSLEAVVESLFQSQKNWDLGIRRIYIRTVFAVFFFGATVLAWFGCSWGWTIMMNHFFLNWAFPLIVLYEALAAGWIFGWASRGKHFGRLGLYIQIVLYICGAVIASGSVSGSWDLPGVWRPITGLICGILVMVVAALLPAWLMHSHDAFGRRHARKTQIHMSIFGSVDHLRNELNYRTCHVNRMWKLHQVFSILIRWVIPAALIFTFVTFTSEPQQLWRFTPYRPFFNHQRDAFWRAEQSLDQYGLIQAPKLFIGLAWGIAGLIAAIPLVAFIFPRWFEWLLPNDTDEGFFNVRKAVEVFAATAAYNDIPVRIGESTAGTYVDAAKKNTIFSSVPTTVSPRRVEEEGEERGRFLE